MSWNLLSSTDTGLTTKITMTKPLNIYTISRINDKDLFSVVEKHLSCSKNYKSPRIHEIESLKLLSDELIKNQVSVKELDGFFFSFSIPRISSEFDLLRLTEDTCLNIELKSGNVTEEKIKKQLNKNSHYLGHLEKRLLLYSVVTDTMTCYRLTPNNTLELVSFNEIVNAIRTTTSGFLSNIDNLFYTSNYLVSPLNTPIKFVQGEYFLTQNQEIVRNSILNNINNPKLGLFFLITGKPGTGKTLLLYDIAKSLAAQNKTLIIHCAKLSQEQRLIQKSISQLAIIPVGDLRNDDTNLSEYNYILIDEVHRMYPEQLDMLCNSAIENDQVCIFSADPEQTLSSAEDRYDIVNRIKALPLAGEFSLSDRIRTNAEIYSFIQCLIDLRHKPKTEVDYSKVELNYANSSDEALILLKYYRERGYIFINFSKSNYKSSPYSVYPEDFDTHGVIGQEFDKVVMLLDSSFYYDKNGILQSYVHPNPDYIYTKLLYQGITRTREMLSLIILNSPELFEQIVSIVE